LVGEQNSREIEMVSIGGEPDAGMRQVVEESPEPGRPRVETAPLARN
jgi:hypothetical protein